MYEYYVRKVENVVDGETIDVFIDLGGGTGESNFYCSSLKVTLP
jgi:hypothetical protein